MATSSNQNRQVASAWWRQLCGWLWKISGFLATSVILSLGISILATWFTSSQGNIPSDSPLARLLQHWDIALLIGCCLLLVAVLAGILSREPALPDISSMEKRNRKRMLQRLQSRYLELIEQSLQGTVRLELQLANKPDAVQNITSLVLHQSNQPEQVLPAGTTIMQVYEQAAHELSLFCQVGSRA